VISRCYLDFDGQTISGTAWNAKTTGPCAADVYDTDAHPAAFSTAELTAIAGVCARGSGLVTPSRLERPADDPYDRSPGGR
jgi:hypothetical protein